MENGKIINRALVELELCGSKIEVISEPVETTPVNLKIEKSQDCEFVAVGGNIKYTVKIHNQCGGELHDVVFKDKLDNCTRFIEGSFRVGEEIKHPEIIDDTLVYTIETVEKCEIIIITFEVKVTDECCQGCSPDPSKSATPIIAPILPFTTTVVGTGVTGATICVEFPNGDTETTTVILGAWRVTSPVRLMFGQTVSAIQTEPGKSKSDIATRTVGR